MKGGERKRAVETLLPSGLVKKGMMASTGKKK